MDANKNYASLNESKPLLHALNIGNIGNNECTYKIDTINNAKDSLHVIKIGKREDKV